MKYLTHGRFSLRHGGEERTAGFRIGTGTVRQGQGMGQRLQAWRSGDGQRLWLSMLVEAMEEVSRPEIREIPCDPKILIAFRAQLARPASPYPYGVSHYSLRN